MSTEYKPVSEVYVALFVSASVVFARGSYRQRKQKHSKMAVGSGEFVQGGCSM